MYQSKSTAARRLHRANNSSNILKKIAPTVGQRGASELRNKLLSSLFQRFLDSEALSLPSQSVYVALSTGTRSPIQMRFQERCWANSLSPAKRCFRADVSGQVCELDSSSDFAWLREGERGRRQIETEGWANTPFQFA